MSEQGNEVRRRRNCPSVRSATTYERIEEIPMLVIKREGKRERFDPEKLVKLNIKSNQTTVTAGQIDDFQRKSEMRQKDRDQQGNWYCC